MVPLRWLSAAASVGGELILSGGTYWNTSTYSQTHYDDMLVLDPETKTWRQYNAMLGPRSDHGMVAVEFASIEKFCVDNE